MAKLSLKQWCEENGRMDLLEGWDTAKNAPLTPENISYGSSTVKLWWNCGKGHSYQMSAFDRKNGRGCPYCAGLKVLPGVNDLATTNPELLAEWNWEKNATLRPEAVIAGTHRKVWWRCAEGHEWQAEIKSRVNGAACPVCTSRTVLAGENDLATLNPELAAQWSQQNEFGPETVTPGSMKKVWWRCEKGHQWKAIISSRTNGAGCPYCANRKVIPGENDLETFNPDLAAQWDQARNGKLTPRDVSPYANRSVWWTCKRGHAFKAPVAQRSTSLTGCPYCTNRKVLVGFNDLATTEPEVAAQWAQDLNGSLTPQKVTKGSSKKVWWRCQFGHVWQAVIFSRTGSRRAGCPVCAGRISAKRISRAKWVESQAETLRP